MATFKAGSDAGRTAEHGRRRRPLRAAAAAMFAVSALAVLGMSPASAQAHGTAAPCQIHTLPSFIDQGQFSMAASVADIVEVGCEPGFAGYTLEVSSPELYSLCEDHLSWSSAYPYAPVSGPSITTTLDSEGNATVALWGGPLCASGDAMIAAVVPEALSTMAETPFQVTAPQEQPEGVTALPSSQVEDTPHGSVATIVEVSFPPTDAGHTVGIRSPELANRCQGAPHLVWVGPDGTVLSGTVAQGIGVPLDDNGNAFVVVLGAQECEPGPSLIEAFLTEAPFMLHSTIFTGKPPQELWIAPPTATIDSPTDDKTYEVGKVVKTKFSCSEGTNGPGLESCTDSNGAAGGSGRLATTATGIYTYKVTAKSKDGLTGTAQITYAVRPNGAKVYEYCGSAIGCGDAFVVKGTTWELPAYGEAGTIETVKVGKVKYTDFRESGNGCLYTSVKTSTGYSSAAAPGTFECSNLPVETWYAFEL